jgi:hypothetical protein
MNDETNKLSDSQTHAPQAPEAEAQHPPAVKPPRRPGRNASLAEREAYEAVMTERCYQRHMAREARILARADARRAEKAEAHRAKIQKLKERYGLV